MYEYNATVERVVDGDTVDVDVDLGFSVHHKRRLRLRGINTPELHAKDNLVRAKALAAKDALTAALAKGPLVIRTFKDGSDKYGRMLAQLYVNGDAISVNDQLVAQGFAVPFMVEETSS